MKLKSVFSHLPTFVRIQAVLQDALAFRAGTAWWLSDQEEEFLRVLSTAPTLFDGVF